MHCHGWLGLCYTANVHSSLLCVVWLFPFCLSCLSSGFDHDVQHGMVTRYVSCDAFQQQLLPVRMRRDAHQQWKVLDPYALLTGITWPDHDSP